jgi:hypothetical protein
VSTHAHLFRHHSWPSDAGSQLRAFASSMSNQKTYHELDRQKPQCKGKRVGRHMFTTTVPTRGYSFSTQSGAIVLEAGEIQGITERTLFDLDAGLDLVQAPLLRGLTVERGTMGPTIIRTPAITDAILSSQGWALQTYPGASLTGASNLISVDPSQDNWSPTHIVGQLKQQPPGQLRLSIVTDHLDKLYISKGIHGHVVFDLEDETCHEVGLEHLHHDLIDP